MIGVIGGRRLAVLLMSLALMAQTAPPREAYPGQGEHKAPPEGWTCSPKASDPDHACNCHRKCKISQPDEEGGNPGGQPYIEEDRKCTVWCHKDHCKCKPDCEKGT